jgi:hypothetical protein
MVYIQCTLYISSRMIATDSYDWLTFCSCIQELIQLYKEAPAESPISGYSSIEVFSAQMPPSYWDRISHILINTTWLGCYSYCLYN